MKQWTPSLCRWKKSCLTLVTSTRPEDNWTIATSPESPPTQTRNPSAWTARQWAGPSVTWHNNIRYTWLDHLNIEWIDLLQSSVNTRLSSCVHICVDTLLNLPCESWQVNSASQWCPKPQYIHQFWWCRTQMVLLDSSNHQLTSRYVRRLNIYLYLDSYEYEYEYTPLFLGSWSISSFQ